LRICRWGIFFPWRWDGMEEKVTPREDWGWGHDFIPVREKFIITFINV
jgi:hypothetical protein